MATAKKPALKKPAVKNSTVKKVAVKTAATKTAAKKQSTDTQRIKVLFAELSGNAIAAITSQSHGTASASRWIYRYAAEHTAWLDSQIDADAPHSDAKRKVVLLRRVAKRLKAFQDLHNYLICKDVDDSMAERFSRAKTDTAYRKLTAERDAQRSLVLEERGIGDRQYPRY